MNPKPGDILMVPINGEPQRMKVLGVSVYLGGESVRLLHIANQSVVVLPVSRVMRAVGEGGGVSAIPAKERVLVIGGSDGLLVLTAGEIKTAAFKRSEKGGGWDLHVKQRDGVGHVIEMRTKADAERAVLEISKVVQQINQDPK